MRNEKSFDEIKKMKQIFAIGFNLTDNKEDDELMDAEIIQYIDLDDIDTDAVMTVVGDVIGRFIHDAAKSEKTRSAMLKILVSNVVTSMDGTEEQPEKDDPSMKDISYVFDSIKNLLEVMKMVKKE